MQAIVNTIPAKHPVRERVAGCSSGPKYYFSKGEIIDTLNRAVSPYALELEPDDCIDMPNNDGHKIIGVNNANGRCVGNVWVSWYRMPSGRYELIAYIT